MHSVSISRNPIIYIRNLLSSEICLQRYCHTNMLGAEHYSMSRSMLSFWDVTPYELDGNSMFHRNDGVFYYVNMMLQPSRPTSIFSLP